MKHCFASVKCCTSAKSKWGDPEELVEVALEVMGDALVQKGERNGGGGGVCREMKLRLQAGEALEASWGPEWFLLAARLSSCKPAGRKPSCAVLS